MPKLLYCAQCFGWSPGPIAPIDLIEIFELSQRHPTRWSRSLGQYEPNPRYIEHAFLEWSDEIVATVLCEIGLDGRDITKDGRAWTLEHARTRIASWQQIAGMEEPDGMDSAIHALAQLTELGARHGATHFVII